MIAEFYARIFFRNSVNGGYLPPLESVERLVGQDPHRRRAGGADRGRNKVINRTQGTEYALRPIGDVLPIIEAGDVFKYAKSVGMVR